MSAALFDLPVEVQDDSGNEYLWIGVVVGKEPNTLIVVDAAGYVQWMPREALRTKWRWMPDHGVWADLAVDFQEIEAPDGEE